MSEYREVAIEEFLRPFAGRPAAYLGNLGNVGDTLIHAGTLRVLERLSITPRLLSEEEVPHHLLLLPGGGTMIDMYESLSEALGRLHDQFEAVVVLPHTIHGARAAALLPRLGPNVHVICRERVSYDFVAGLLACPERVYLSPDMAFHFDYGPYRQAGDGTLNAFRRDGEQTAVPIPADNIDLADHLELPGRPFDHDFCRLPYWRDYLDAYLTRIAASARVRTNRLHVGIAAAMLDKDVELHENSYYKVRAVYQYSLASRFPAVQLVPAPAPPARAPAPAPPPVRREPSGHTVTLHPPEVAAHQVTFAFEVDPPSALYRATRFSLRFPPEVDVSHLPDRLWWTVFLLALHGSWPYLLPARIRLPVGLTAGESEFWRRLVLSYLDSLAAYKTGDPPSRELEVVGQGPPLAPFPHLPDAGWCGTAFSGGKDSLVQVGLLDELGGPPLVVATSLEPGDEFPDFRTPRRRWVMSEIRHRRPMTFVEVLTDLRTIWNNAYPLSQGYSTSVTETSDCHLYLSSLLAVSMAKGATHLFLASEAEVQENVERDGRIIQHPHLMYSNITQRALSAWLEPAGMSYGALTWPLHSAQVLQLLWTRYRDLADLQTSCWMVGPTDPACNRCSQCLRIALGILAVGGRPERIGIDLVRLLTETRTWQPRWPAAPDGLPRDRVSAHLSAGVIRSIRAVSPARVLASMTRSGGVRRVVEPATWSALHVYRGRRKHAAAVQVEPARYRPGFLRLVDPLVRHRLGAILDAHVQPAPDETHAAMVGRADALTAWITAPLRG